MFERSGPFSQVTGSVCRRERAHSDKGAPAGVFMVFECELGFMQTFSAVLCAAVRNNGMCSLPSTVTGQRGSALPLKGIWPNMNPEYCNKTPTERRERRQNLCQVGISKCRRLILQSLMRAEKPCFWDLSRFHE